MTKEELMATQDAKILLELMKQNEEAIDSDVRAHFTELCNKRENMYNGYDENGIHYDPNDMLG